MNKSTRPDQIQTDAFLEQVVNSWQKLPRIFDSYASQRQRFMLNRLQLQTQIMLGIGITMLLFLLWVVRTLEMRIYILKVGLVVEIFIGVCWFLCKTSLGRRYPDLMLLSLCWSVTCVVQIDMAILSRNLEPLLNMWMLMFLNQAMMVPVNWKLHLISQIGTVTCYGVLYVIFQMPDLAFGKTYYIEHFIYLFWTCLICIISVFLYEKLSKDEFFARKELEVAQQKSERLLLNILPETIAEKLKQEPKTIANSFHEVSVLFADIVGFTELSSYTSPVELVEVLNEIFSIFDKLAEKHGVEKIKTIGDAYMAVAGLPIQNDSHAVAIANMALDMQAAINEFNQERNLNFHIRVGISTGPVVAGVIGLKKFAYDLWGDTVNTASRMESHGIAGCIQVCKSSYEQLQDKFIFQERGLIKVKGKGEMMTYLLVDRKSFI